jgi:hypothetical protein
MKNGLGLLSTIRSRDDCEDDSLSRVYFDVDDKLQKSNFIVQHYEENSFLSGM